VSFTRRKKCPRIEIVFHSAVQRSKSGQCFQFFGNHRFARIGLQYWSRKSQKRRIFDFNSAWPDHIAETYVDLHGNPCPSKSCSETNADAFVAGILFDPRDAHRFPIEFNAIGLRFHCAHLSDEFTNVLKLILRLFAQAGRCPSWSAIVGPAMRSIAAHL